MTQLKKEQSDLKQVCYKFSNQLIPLKATYVHTSKSDFNRVSIIICSLDVATVQWKFHSILEIHHVISNKRTVETSKHSNEINWFVPHIYFSHSFLVCLRAIVFIKSSSSFSSKSQWCAYQLTLNSIENDSIRSWISSNHLLKFRFVYKLCFKNSSLTWSWIEFFCIVEVTAFIKWKYLSEKKSINNSKIV